MKAILEFNYPDDEDKLRRAIHADQAFDGLQKVKSLINGWHIHTKADYEELLEAVKDRKSTRLNSSHSSVSRMPSSA